MIAIIDYGVGNLFSVEKAFVRLGANVVVTNDADVIEKANKVVLPGVGAFGDCMKNLEASGLIPIIRKSIAAGKPLLGICVGLQILFEGSEESPEAKGLGIFKGQVKKINAAGLKIPHMGWNSLILTEAKQNIHLFAKLPETAYVYFVHSFHAVPEEPAIITAYTEYGQCLTAAIARDNIQATQFHPEKSGDIGLTILQSFIDG